MAWLAENPPGYFNIRFGGGGYIFPFWTPNFNGVNSYAGLITTFAPTGAGTELTVSGIYKSNAATQQLLAPDASAFALTVGPAVLPDAVEEVVNGTFDTDSDWGLGVGFSISGGLLRATDVADFQTATSTALSTTIGKTYIATLTVEEYTSGAPRIYIRANGRYQDFSVIDTTIGAVTTLTWIAYSEADEIRVYGLGGQTTAAFDNVSAKEVTQDVLEYSLLSNVTVDGLPATSGVTVVPSGYHELKGDLAASADIDIIAANAAFGENFKTQLHYIGLNDPLDADNSLEIDTVIRSELMPTETSLFNKLDNNKVGDLLNIGTTQPYVPQLKGGEIDRSYVDGKSEAYNGDYTDINWTLGVDTSRKLITSLATQGKAGSWSPSNDLDIPASAILVAKTGAVIKIASITSPTASAYTTLLGTDALIQAGFSYPNVFRVLKPDADTNSEYYYYNNGGSFPWTN